MKLCRELVTCAILSLSLLSGDTLFAASPITSLNELKSLGRDKGVVGHPLRVKGVVVCYDEGWHQLYLHDGLESLYFNADDFRTKPQTGQLVEITGTAYGSESFTNVELNVLGPGKMPAAKRLKLSELSREHGEWVEISGQVLSAEASRGRLALLLHDTRQNCLAYVLGGPPAEDIRQWLRCRVRVRGINASKARGTQLEPAMVFVPGLNEVTIIEPAQGRPTEIPVASIGSLLSRELGSWTNHWVHVNGLVTAYEPGRSLLVKDPTGLIRAQVVQMTDMRGDERVEVWGFLEMSSAETFLNCSYFEVVHSSFSSGTDRQPETAQASSASETVLRQIPQILKLGRNEAARRLPVRVGGVVTFADSDWRNAFIQDGGEAVYVYLGPNDPTPESGQWVEVSGQTSPGGFAPEVLSSRVTLLGATNLPAAALVDLEDLANGHLDAHWVEMRGIVRRAEKQSGHLVLSLMTPTGRFKVMIPGFENQAVPNDLIDALVSVSGACTSELNSRRQLSGITLHAPGLKQVKVVDPPPADPFAIETMAIATIGTFDPNRFSGRRVKVAGVVTLKVPGPGFIIQDASGGMRILSREADGLHAGDQVEALGFPAIGDFSPYLEDGVFRTNGKVTLPEAKQTTAEQILLQGTADAQLVELRARLLQNVPRAANPQLLLQDGPIIFTAHLETQDRREDLPAWRSGSLLKLTGVCTIQGGERHEPETFRLLIGKPGGIELLEAPPWWTSRQAFTAAGGMGVAIVAALAWVGLLRRQVRAQTKMILEISTREQRRIGHDLHDGVCQQLAGIAFMTSALADELEEQKVPQAAQADRISTMINEVIDHTRSVARGLFPIWLEENGLASALEELATNASEIFKINCRFLNERGPANVENSVALHLYYIALEAVANAAKHGRAQNIVIRLEPAAERYCLSIQDDGTGFSVGSPATTGMGLRIMNYRARVVGAVLQLESLPGSGTRVACLVLPESTRLARVGEQKLSNEQAVGRK
jgi:signal transduction histidine kinase